ncbi:hypothetical protein D3C84_1214550 [compost metagenome]
MIDQRFTDGVTSTAHHREHAFGQIVRLHRVADRSSLNFRSTGVRVMRLENDGRTGGQR